MLFKGALSATSAAKRHCAIAVVLASLFPAWAAAPGLSPVALPEDYVLLDGVSSDGHGQYVDTEYVFKTKPSVVCGMKLPEGMLTANKDPLGTPNYSQDGCFGINFDSSFYYRYGKTTSNSTVLSAAVKEALVADYAPCAFSNEVWIAGTKILGPVSGDNFPANTQTFYVFSGSGRPLASSFSYVKMYDGGELVRDYLPCKDPSGTVGLWDGVEGTFKSSAANGSLVADGEGRACTLVVESSAGGQAAVAPAPGNYFGVSGDVEFTAPSGGSFECEGAAIYELDGGAWTLAETKTASAFTLTLDAAKRTKVVWQWKAELGMDDPTHVSSAFSTAVIAAQVTGIGKAATSATLTFKYGTTPDAADGSVAVTGSAAGEWRATLQHLAAGVTYYVKATLANDAGDEPVTSRTISFVQPETDEPGVATSRSYARRDHLVAFWDGYDNVALGQGDRSATTWADVSGHGFDWTLAAGTYEWTDRGLWLQNFGRVGSLQQTGEDFKNKVKTIEFVYANKQRKHAIIFGPGFGSTTYLYTDEGAHVGFYGTQSTKIGAQVALDETNCFSVVYAGTGATPSGVANFRVNGVSRSNEGMGDHWSSGLTEPVLGDRTSGGLAASGELFAIRIYDVELTDVERAQNYRIDVMRYLEGRNPVGALQIDAGRFVVTTPASAADRTAVLCWGDIYGGTNEWPSASEPVTIPAGATTVSFDAPPGWEAIVHFARAKIAANGEVRWSQTLVAESPVPRPEPGTDPRLRLGLPADYVQMTKLKSTGNERIDTDFIPSSTTATEFEFGEVTVDDIQRTFFGQDWDYYRYLFKVKNRTFYFNGNDTGIVKIETDGRDYSVTIAPTTSPNGTLTVIDKSTGESTAKTLSLSANDSIKLSIFSYAKGMNYPGKFALYSLKFWDDGEPAADFVPVWKVSTSEAGFYDFVSGNFYASATATPFARQPAIERLRLAFEDPKLVATVEASEYDQTITLYAGATYGGVDGWGEPVQTKTVPAGETTAVFDKPAGWGKTVWYARAVTGEGASAAWSRTVIAEPPAPIGIDSTLVLASSVFGSSEIAATVTGIGMADSATLAFAYGTTPDLSDGTVEVTVNEIGTWRGTLPHWVAGQTYYVQATLDNHEDQPVKSGVYPFVQPDIFESGLNPRIRTMPEGYVQMEKLKSTGGEYIQTEVTPTTKTAVEFEFGELAVSDQKQFFGPVWNWSTYGLKMNSGYLQFFGYSGAINIIAAAANCDYVFTVTPTGDGIGTIFATNLTTHVGNEMTGAPLKDSTTSFGVFANYSGGNKSTFSLYSLKFRDDVAIAADFVPAWSIAEEKAGLYDFKSGNFYASATATSFDRQAFLAGISLEQGDAGLVVTTLASSEKRTVSLYAGADYGGVDGWGAAVATKTLEADETSVTFDLPDGWGRTVWFARVHVGDGETDWSKTLIAADANRPSATLADARAIGTDKFVLSGTLDSFVGESCTVTPVVTDSSGTAIDFSAAAKTFDAPGEFSFDLPASITAGETYSVCVEMAADGKKSRSKTLTVAVGAVGTLTPLDPGASAPVEVAVEGSPDARTAVAPVYGRYAADENKVYSFSAPTSALVDGREYSLLGYEVYEGEALAASGEGNAFTFATDRGGFRVVWKWNVVYTTTVMVPDEQHGTAEARQSAAAHGGTARFTATPETGYAVAWTGESVPNEQMFERELVLENVQGPVSAVATFFIPSANEGEKTGLFATYAYSTPITFAGYDGTTVLTNFPALIRMREADGDVRFCGADGRELDSEVVKLDPSGTSEFWVKVPRLTNRTRIFAVWGNPDAPARTPAVSAFEPGFRGVWTMESAKNLLLDRSVYGQHAACLDESVSPVASGVIGGARHFAGETDGYAWLGVGGTCLMEPKDFTVECWFKVTDYPTADGYFFASGERGSGASYCTFGIDGEGRVFGSNCGAYTASAASRKYPWSREVATKDEWHHAAYTQAANGEEFVYLDGVMVGAYTNVMADIGWGEAFYFEKSVKKRPGNPTIGAYRPTANASTRRFFTGDLDEARLSGEVRSADWVRATYLNVASNATFAVFGGERETLTVDGEPRQLTPAIEVSAPASERDGVRRTCTGYAVVADGKLIDSGVGASVSRAWPAGAKDVAISWNWKTEYEVTVGDVSGWYEAGTVLPVAAGAASAGQAFHSWSGNCPTLEVFSASFDLPVDGPRTLTANYASLTEVTAVADDPAASGERLHAALETALAAGGPQVLLVGDGVYQMTNTVKIAAPIVIRSANGFAKTTLTQASQFRFFELSDAGALLEGFAFEGETKYQPAYPTIAMVTEGHVSGCRFSLKPETNYSGSTDRAEFFNQSGGWCRDCVFTCLGEPTLSTMRNYGAGGVFTHTLVDRCVFTNLVGYASPVLLGPNAVVRNTLIAKNRAGKDINGGAVRALANNLAGSAIENCTIANNTNFFSAASVERGGALYLTQPLLVVNTILSGNRAPTALCGNDFDGPIAALNSISVDFTGGECGSKTSLPEYLTDEAGNPDTVLYRTGELSPSRDAGYPTAWSRTPGAWDFLGTNRVVGAAVDIGASEYVQSGASVFNASIEWSGDTTQRDRAEVALEVRVSGAEGEVTYEWDFGDGTCVTNNTGSFSHIYVRAGFYTVRVTVSDEAGHSATRASPSQIKVLPATCYVNSAGSHEPPYATRETGAASILDVREFSPSKIVVCADTTSNKSGDGSDKLCNLDYAVEVVGEDPVSSVIADRVHVNHASAVMRGLTCTSSKYQQSTDIGTFALTAGLVSNVTFTGCSPIPRSTANREVLKIYAGGRVVDSRFCDNNPLYDHLGPRVWAAGASAIGIYGGAALVDRCIVTNNLGGWAKGTYAAGIKVMGDYTPAPVIRNSLIAGNMCGDGISTNTVGGAGIYARGTVVVENCTIVTNVTAGAGAGVYVTAGAPEIVNTIIASNAGGMTNAAEICSNEVFVAEGASATWTASRVPIEAGVSGSGVVTADPRFSFDVRKDRPWWSLRGNSPCRNAGVEMPWMEGATDLGGNPRVFLGKPDMGCHENTSRGTLIFVR